MISGSARPTSAEMLSTLSQGATLVQQALSKRDLTVDGYSRIAEILDASHQITWAYVDAGGAIRRVGNGPVTEIQVVLLGDAAPPGLDGASSFQTNTDDDGGTRVYVRSIYCTPRWAGAVLFHELEHVIDHRDGVFPSDPRPEDWWAEEARAYVHEALVLDAVCGGSLLPRLDALCREVDARSLLELSPVELSVRLQREAFPPAARTAAASSAEEHLRAAALSMAAVLAVEASPGPLATFDASGAGMALRRAATAWGWATPRS